jgi:hypothetical protein
MFKKPKRNFRGRRKDSINDDDTSSKSNDNGDGRDSIPNPTSSTLAEPPSSSLPKKVKKKKKQDSVASDGSIHRSSSTLSFGQEEEGIVQLNCFPHGDPPFAFCFPLEQLNVLP